MTVNDTFLLEQGDTLLVVEEYKKYGRRALKLKMLNVDYLGLEVFDEWIEGIGSTSALYSPNVSSSLICFESSDCQCISCDFFDDIMTKTPDIKHVKKLSIYPNPTTSSLNIQTSILGTYIIYNLNGRIMNNGILQKK